MLIEEWKELYFECDKRVTTTTTTRHTLVQDGVVVAVPTTKSAPKLVCLADSCGTSSHGQKSMADKNGTETPTHLSPFPYTTFGIHQSDHLYYTRIQEPG